MPRIFADTEEGGFFAVGYAQAEDRLEHILKYQLMIEGRLGELGLPEARISDASARRWLHREEARAGFDRLPADLQGWYRAYVAGVEHYLATHPDEVPAWAPALEPWLPIASLRM